MLLSFVLGLVLGLLTLLWYRARTQRQLKQLLLEIKPHHAISSLPVLFQISTTISHQSRKCQVLENRLQRYQFMLERAPIGFLHIDDENRLVWCNQFAQTLFNLSSSQFSQSQYPQPRLLLEVIRSYELDQLTEQIRQYNQLCDKEWTFFPINANPARVRKQKSYRLRGYGIPLFNNHVGIFIENRQDLVTLKQQRDRWTSDIAHELKTPLTSIRLIAEILQSRLDSALVGWADRLVNQSARLSTLVQDLLDLSQMEIEGNNQDCLSLKTVSLPELIQAAWLNLDPIARKKNLNFQYIGPSRLIAHVDESRMYRVILNLLDNSIKYSPPRETVIIKAKTIEWVDESSKNSVSSDSLSREMKNESQESQDVVLMEKGNCFTNSTNHWIQIEVIDAGNGFLENDLPYIFERFYRADVSRTRLVFSESEVPNGEAIGHHPASHLSVGQSPGDSFQGCQSSQPGGTGLGLAIVHQIIKAHRGSIEAQNHPQTGGAVIRIQLPQDVPAS